MTKTIFDHYLVATLALCLSGSLTHCGAGLLLPPGLSTSEIEKYLIVGFKRQSEGDAVNLQNGEFGADREVLSQGGTSPTGASFPTINSVFDQRWEPQGNEAYLRHPVFNTQVAPFEGIDYSGNIALTSRTGRISVSDTDLFADLGGFDPALDDIGIVAANPSNPVQSISNADYFNAGAGENSPLGELPTNAGGTNGVGLAKDVDLKPLLDELNAWQTFIDGQASEGLLASNIENESYKDSDAPFVIELLGPGGVADPASDLAYEDVNGDGFVFIDVLIDRVGSDWEINNSDVLIDGPDDVVAIFRIGGESNMNMSDSSIQIGEGGILDNGFGAIFYKGDSEGGGSGDAVFSGNNVVLNGVAFWELNEGTDDRGKNEIDIQNGQGCAQFIGSTVLHTSNSRFNRCALHGVTIPEPGSLVVAGLMAIVGSVYRTRSGPR